ncbi:preprotein translocase subunit SecE [Dermatophilus congolensis]|uniref:Protein translocase subunit SecE n=1 Tax=Dermatophilus congolensis TaxID=1863 RepID=A0A239VSE9_9MICO|nr:preprotein translocase subunit SecE [Dermatophilus congolensis]MBO3129782.1 preprotein translocase subunit SecE [Dermatophilus congolensis]MBO3131588.1 preprotein translocase subunit SecE [Dermatophilus congolensis]MBO3134256.1 preprotein translocase subunit SecE [Dermatophilus congolensis]MBO3136489.1 preprotein translocase subunit SecE [Dermatophilus congolensis]MBO3138738.1 preprotein translocase subunit SecE [Dermatophilus congolensis]
MANQKTAPVGSSQGQPARSNLFTRFFASIALFFRQVFDELGKVVRPSREELARYTATVIVFVTIVMLFVFGLDWVFTRLVFWIFAE